MTDIFDSDEPEKSVRYTYDQVNDTWSRERALVHFATRPFAAGGMRVCYKMRISGSSKTLVAKMFMKKVRPEVYFDEAMTQMLAESYAQEFNKRYPERPISFLPVSVFQLKERGGQLVNIEPFLDGTYVKHNDNDGNVETSELLPQAFSHFSWEASDKQILIIDIQGVGDFYTDPQIHSWDGESFGQGNLGMPGINAFLQSHTCNRICRCLNLPPLVAGKSLGHDSVSSTSSINISEEQRSKSPMRWKNGRRYKEGLERARTQLDRDDEDQFSAGVRPHREAEGGDRKGRGRPQDRLQSMMSPLDTAKPAQAGRRMLNPRRASQEGRVAAAGTGISSRMEKGPGQPRHVLERRSSSPDMRGAGGGYETFEEERGGRGYARDRGDKGRQRSHAGKFQSSFELPDTSQERGHNQPRGQSAYDEPEPQSGRSQHHGQEWPQDPRRMHQSSSPVAADRARRRSTAAATDAEEMSAAALAPERRARRSSGLDERELQFMMARAVVGGPR